MREHYLFALGTSLVGISVGALTVLTQSVVVTLLIPLLFSLIAGASGFYLAREDITQADGRRRLAFVGICVGGLCVGLLGGVTATFWIQSKFATDRARIADVSTSPMTLSEQIFVAEVYAVADMLGVDQADRITMAKAALSEGRTTREDPADGLRQAAEAETVAALQDVAELDISELSLVEDEDFRSTIAAVRTLATAMLAVHAAQPGSAIDMQVWDSGLNIVREPLGELVGTTTRFPITSFEYLSRSAEAVRRMVRLRSALDVRAQLKMSQVAHLDTGATLLGAERKELIRLLRGKGEDVLSVAPAGNFYPTIAQAVPRQDGLWSQGSGS